MLYNQFAFQCFLHLSYETLNIQDSLGKLPYYDIKTGLYI